MAAGNFGPDRNQRSRFTINRSRSRVHSGRKLDEKEGRSTCSQIERDVVGRVSQQLDQVVEDLLVGSIAFRDVPESESGVLYTSEEGIWKDRIVSEEKETSGASFEPQNVPVPGKLPLKQPRSRSFQKQVTERNRLPL